MKKRKSFLALIMDWNIFFTSPGYSLVTNQILELLDYETIMVCREVSPIWKQYIDEQRFWRVNHLLSLMDKYFAKLKDKTVYKSYRKVKVHSFCEKFPEWNKIIPYIKTEMNVSDMDILIGAKLYTKKMCHLEVFDFGEERDCAKSWCPLHWAVYFKNFKFVEVMIRTPFDFNTLKFVFEDNPEEDKANCEKCDRRRHEREMHWGPDVSDDGYGCVFSNSILHQASRNGDIKMIKLILRFAEEKKININAKNRFGQSAIVTAKDDPEVVKLMLKHCKFDRSDLGKLGLNTYAYMAESILQKDEPPKKKMKTTKK